MNRRYAIALCFVVGLSGVAKAAAGPSCAELNQLWRDKFHRDFKVAWALQPFECPSGTSRAAKAFYDVWKPSLPRDYYLWAKQLIKTTTHDPKCTYYAHMSSMGTLTLCKGFFSSNDEGRAGTIIHEAAHGRPGDPGHTTCTRGASIGKANTCDQKFFGGYQGSGYNFEFMFYSQLLELTDTGGLDPALILGYIRNGIRNNFNEITDAQVRQWVP